MPLSQDSSRGCRSAHSLLLIGAQASVISKGNSQMYPLQIQRFPKFGSFNKVEPDGGLSCAIILKISSNGPIGTPTYARW